jgi:hypothetical protein
MKFKTLAICTGIKESKGDFEGKAFSSTTFHCIVDVAENGAGRSIGAVTRPFKFGDASEFEKWAHLSKSWPATGLPVECEFDMVAGSDNSTKLVLLGIKPNGVSVKSPAATV